MKKIPMRFWVGLIGVFFCVFVCYIVRLNINILIVAMVKQRGKYKPPACDPKRPPPKKKRLAGRRYPWSQQVQGQMLGAYGYGFIFTNILGGYLSETLGPWNVILYSNVLCAVLVAVTGYSAMIHYGVTLFIRIVLGLTGGLQYPAVQCLIAKWAPPKEKSKFIGLLMGNTMGSIFVLFLGGLLADVANYDAAYLVFGATILVFCIVFGFLVTDTPHTHKLISEEEKEYIISEQANTVSKKKAAPPYKDILINVRVWAAIIAQFGNMWGLFFQMTCVPKFLAEILGFNLKSAGILAALPYLGRFVAGMLFGILGDYLLKKNLMSKGTLRKVFTVFSHIIPAIMICMIFLLGCNVAGVVCMLIFSLMVNGAAVLTHLQAPQDLAPNFAGTIYGFMQTLGAIPGFLAPVILAVFIKKKNGIDEWKWNFIICGVIYAFGGIIYMVFGNAELQKFNNKVGQEEPADQPDAEK